MPIVVDTKLYEQVKAMADKKYSKPSAYKSGYIVKTYKQMGGRYKEDGRPKNLKRWYKERWTNVGNKDYPVLRPTVKVSKKTPLLPSEISNLKEQIKLKQKIKGKNLPPFISHDISMKGGAPNINVRRLNHVMPGLRLTDMEKQILVDEINRIRLERGIATSRASKIIPTIFMAATGGAVPQTIRDEVLRMFQEMFDDGMTDQEGEGGRMYGGMDRLPQESLHEISGFLRPPRVHQTQQQFPGYTHRIMPVEHGVREQQRIRARNIQNLGVMNENRRERMEAAREFVESPVQEQIAEIENGLPILHVRQMYRMTNANLPYQLLIRYPAIGSGRKGGVRKDKDIILPPPAVARPVTGEATRPFEGQEVYADFPEAPSVFSDFTLAEEQREIARAEQRDQANIDSLYRLYGQMYPGGLAAPGSADAYSQFTDRYLPSRRMNESYVANLPPAERRRIIAAYLRQRQGTCVASGKPKRVSKWIEHVKAHAKKHGVSYKQAMQDSRRTYAS